MKSKQISVAFTGYRESKILKSKQSQSGVGRDTILNTISERTYLAIEKLHENGCLYFYNGMSSGFDLIAALAVLELRGKYPEVKLIAVVPFKGQESKYTDKDKETYKQVIAAADKVVILAENYTDNAQFLRRNDYMLEQSSQLVCYYDGQRGGTMYTYNRAIKIGMQIINICEL